MNRYENMGPFKPVSLKGGARINAVPTFIHQLPLTLGGIAGEDLPFGRVVSIDPSTNRREFKLGIPDDHVVKGLVMFNPSISRADPGMNNYYFAGRPVDITTMGIIDILEWDTSKDAPMEGSTVWCRNSDGMLAFNDGTDISSSGYTQLNAFVYETLDPNGAKVFFNLPLVTTQVRETTTATATPTASPAAGAIASGTGVVLTSTSTNARIYYTLDGTTPTMESAEYTGPIEITAAVTIKAIAIAEGHDPSAVLSAAYTIL